MSNSKRKEVREKDDVVLHGLVLPNLMWFGLKDACQLKGLNYKTSCNRVELQPNKGIADGYIGGRKKWKRETIIAWFLTSDSQLLGEETYE